MAGVNGLAGLAQWRDQIAADRGISKAEATEVIRDVGAAVDDKAADLQAFAGAGLSDTDARREAVRLIRGDNRAFGGADNTPEGQAAAEEEAQAADVAAAEERGAAEQAARHLRRGLEDRVSTNDKGNNGGTIVEYDIPDGTDEHLEVLPPKIAGHEEGDLVEVRKPFTYDGRRFNLVLTYDFQENDEGELFAHFAKGISPATIEPAG